MKRIRVHDYNDYIVEISDEDYEELLNGDVDIAELLEEKQQEDKAWWKNGGTEWE